MFSSPQLYLTRIHNNDRYCGYLLNFKASMCCAMRSETRKTLTKHSIAIHFRKSSRHRRDEKSVSIFREKLVFSFAFLSPRLERNMRKYTKRIGGSRENICNIRIALKISRDCTWTRVRSLFILVIQCSLQLNVCYFVQEFLGKGKPQTAILCKASQRKTKKYLKS